VQRAEAPVGRDRSVRSHTFTPIPPTAAPTSHQQSASDPDVWFLSREGFHIDCTGTGSAGLAMARTVAIRAFCWICGYQT